jgi:hypothetical protein
MGKIYSDGNVLVGDIWYDNEGDLSEVVSIDYEDMTVHTLVISGPDAGYKFREELDNFDDSGMSETAFYQSLVFRAQTGECDEDLINLFEPEGEIHEKVACG